ncbi:MAG: helix-turn-helix domain-containing protein [Actinomycetota bacterium]
MGYKYDEDEILAAAVEAVLDEGLSRLSFGRLAQRMGIADRSIVYYFPTKADLVTRTAFAIGLQLQSVLAEAFGDEPLDGRQLMRRAWPVLTAPDADPLFAAFFELTGLGAASVTPFDTLAPMLIEAWVDWLTPRIDPADPAGGPDAVRSEAYALVATLDGLLLLHHTTGTEAARRAAAALDVIDP